jgi:AcrR family transcriptional regulator
MEATFEIFREIGYEKMTMDAVAARAGVGKATIYRWYPTKDDLLVEALSWKAEQDHDSVPDTGSLVGDLIEMIKQRLAKDPLCLNRQACASTVSALAGNNALSQTYWETFLIKKRGIYSTIFQRAKARKELAVDADTDLFLDMYWGYMLFGVVMRPKGTVDVSALEEVLHHLVRAFAPR